MAVAQTIQEYPALKRAQTHAIAHAAGRCRLSLALVANQGRTRAALPKNERTRASRMTKRERGIWQRRYWEHQVRDEAKLEQRVDYFHYNPAKHGWFNRPVDWPHSTLHNYIERGILTADWGVSADDGINGHGER